MDSAAIRQALRDTLVHKWRAEYAEGCPGGQWHIILGEGAE